MRIVLFEPEIPQNTGNIARLCAATGTELHLVEPLGFKLENRCLKRAGLDYWPHVRLFAWPDWQAYTAAVGHSRAVMTSAKGGCPVQHFVFEAGDSLIFGPETRGLPPEILAASPWKTRIPMYEGGVRSLNLSTAAGVVLYMALSRCGCLESWT
ncbi:tRNA (cytidine(34)-2'-O)-methyltransferase [Candidatus Desulfovibrio trichonymphae]|uniref:Putative tRNA (cytidine(34)-2'-O)-methyltransferase n=1 Tax=Candidatus Desulfovibrio trichonymphae TaxID=1725232 RepID=A0A1J1DX49_9BACT|nr:tRNA (cytidine(34)-2'-O)-methyltransferase [Candidatus Desulfovibrio trichonymphae]BAV91670.1 tRNA (cytidine34-2'-O)-methyltransferase [Candidatus Desulfovibrio trichonymphae]GHU91139.1 tRNA (cytidine(34)-2'-O)-methyltransferase [Deltaproteobacteria bacterium]GHU94903.1 tRNA (cytidine(34)-2'-O)-methyltransferase [Deltaproteobacteria bacterium]GHU98316.1 tRNA (cytidine(34)-2'-O)-methyltransferase [Deltaproteobacteria bacterium]